MLGIGEKSFFLCVCESKRENNFILFYFLKAAWLFIFSSVSRSSRRGMLLPTRPIFTLLPPTLGKPKLSLPGMRRPQLPVLRDGSLSAQPKFKRLGSPSCRGAAPLPAPAPPTRRPGALGARGPSENPH